MTSRYHRILFKIQLRVKTFFHFSWINFGAFSVLEVLTCTYRRSRPEGNLRKGVLKICSKFTGEHACHPLRHACSPVNLLHIFRTPFPKNTSGWLLLDLHFQGSQKKKNSEILSTRTAIPPINAKPCKVFEKCL